jgi:hypothetical protein
VSYYYPKTVYNISVALTDLFNDLTIYRYDSNGTSAKAINVPISFGPMEKTFQFRKEQESGQRYYLQLPRMAIIMNGVTFAADRARSLEETREWLSQYVNIAGSNNTLFEDFQPTPWDYHFTLNIRTELLEDFSQIIENILPWFAPKRMLRVKEFSFLNIERDLPVSLVGMNTDFTDDIDETQMRQINGTIDLVVEGWMYKGPIAVAKIVKAIKSQYFVGINNNFINSFVTSGFNATSAIPTSGWQTSGYNANTEVYWTHNMTSAGSIV